MTYPKTLTEAVARIADCIAPLPWAEQVLGRVAYYPHQVAGQDKPSEVPMVLTGGQWVDARPSDRITSLVFFHAPDPEKSDFDRSKHSPHHAIRAERRVNIMGWVNLEQLDSCYRSDDAFPEEVKVSLKQALKDELCVKAIGEWRDGDPAKVFQPFSLGDLRREWQIYPYAAFSLSVTVMMIEYADA